MCGRWCQGGYASRPEREFVRLWYWRSIRFQQAVARLRHHRRSRTRALHLAAPGRLHRRRHRRDGRNAEHHAPAALPAAVRLRPHPARDAPLLPLRQVPRHTGPHPRRHARRADLHRHHRRFPGETEEDFQQTMDVVRQARFSSAFTFIYSPRPGTPPPQWNRFRATWCRTGSTVWWRCRSRSPKRTSPHSRAATSK